MLTSPLLACMIAATEMNGLPPRVLPAIQAVEGGRPGLVSRNANGTEDLGLMQVNTVWLGPVARATGLPEAAIRARLIEDGCFGIHVAGAILRLHLRAERGDLMRAIGNYHSRTAALNLAYQARVVAQAERLFAPTGSRATARGG